MNVVSLAGNLGADAELRYTQGETPVLNLRLATQRVYYKDEEKQEVTDWHTCVLWGNRAEALAKYLEKGTPIAITGRLATRSWEDDDGNKRYVTEVIVTDLTLQGRATKSSAERSESRPAGKPTKANRGKPTKANRGKPTKANRGKPKREEAPEGDGHGSEYGDDYGDDDVPF